MLFDPFYTHRRSNSRRIEPSDHYHLIQRLLNQIKYGILAFLSGIANRVETHKTIIQLLGSILTQHGCLKQHSDLTSFPF